MLIIIIVSVIMAGATFCALAKPGEKDGISKYGQEDSEK
jgi:hypothetical protein